MDECVLNGIITIFNSINVPDTNICLFTSTILYITLPFILSLLTKLTQGNGICHNHLKLHTKADVNRKYTHDTRDLTKFQFKHKL